MNTTKLSNVQLELLKLYAEGVSDTEIAEIRQLLGMYYAKKAIAAADKVWEEKQLTNEVMESWLKKKMRTPYLTAKINEQKQNSAMK